MNNKILYPMIFKRKSFHLFRNIGNLSITVSELKQIESTYQRLDSLCPGIKTGIRIVPAAKTACKRGEEYCILFYSEHRDNYLQNIGYIGEQLDLYLVSQDIGTLWFGVGKPDMASYDGLDFVIMMAISKIDHSNKFRRDMFKSKRKSVDEIWIGTPVEGVSNLVRFAPSACNTQPWIVEHVGSALRIYRFKKPGKRGIMPADKVSFYNQIDMGIFLCFLELCLQEQQIAFRKELSADYIVNTETTLTATYKLDDF